MSRQHTVPADWAESTCTSLSCTSAEFHELYDNDRLYTNTLSQDAIENIIGLNREHLREANPRYRLDVFLSAMLDMAPNQSGKRYVAVALHIAHKKEKGAVVDIAKAWMDYLFLPMLVKARDRARTEPSSSQTPTLGDTIQGINNASQSDQQALRDRVADREQYHCAITGAVDRDYVKRLQDQGNEDQIPAGPRRSMSAAYIISLSLSNFQNHRENTTIEPEGRDTARTWDMLRAWTGIDIRESGSKIESPANLIYMTIDEHLNFGEFEFYLDKDAYPAIPNKYEVCMARRNSELSNEKTSAVVQFRDTEPPDEGFLRVHAAFAKVLNICGVANYLERVEGHAEKGGNMRLSEQDWSFLLVSRLQVLMN